MITVDSGITGNAEVDFAASIGLDVVITDHHECKEELPAACAVVDPHRPDCPYPFKHLAGVGVALKLVLAPGRREPGGLPVRPVLLPGGHWHHCRRHADGGGKTAPSSPAGWRPCPTRISWGSTPC